MDNIRPVRLGLSSAGGRVDLLVNAARFTSSLSARSEASRKYYPEETTPAGTQSIEVVSLDQWAQDGGVKPIDLVKLDLQGHELDALRGSTKLLQSSVRLVFTEVEFLRLYEGSCRFHEIVSFLERYAFDLYQLYDLHTGADGQLIYGDALFLRRTRLPWPK
jgi:FkbM family methyltransferase